MDYKEYKERLKEVHVLVGIQNIIIPKIVSLAGNEWDIE